jgi:hypothetical protein
MRAFPFPQSRCGMVKFIALFCALALAGCTPWERSLVPGIPAPTPTPPAQGSAREHVAYPAPDVSLTILDRQAQDSSASVLSWQNCPPYMPSALMPAAFIIKGSEAAVMRGVPPECKSRNNIFVTIGPILLTYDCTIEISYGLGAVIFSVDHLLSGSNAICNLTVNGKSGALLVYLLKGQISTRSSK